MAVLKYYDAGTSSWKYIAASTTANFTTWKKTMSGGETSVSGTDDNSVTLSYTVGLEQVFINGALQARGSDYTATTGTTITGLSVLSANDIVSVVCYAPFNVTNTYTKSETDSLLAAAPGLRMVVPTSVAVGSGSGSVDTNGAVTFSGASSVSLNGCFTSTYSNYRVIFTATGSTFAGCYFRTRLSGTDASGSNYSYQKLGASGSSASVSRGTGVTSIELGYLRSGGASSWSIDVFAPNIAEPTKTIHHNTDWADGTNIELYFGTGFHYVSTAYDGMTLLPNSGTFSGTVRVYGYKN